MDKINENLDKLIIDSLVDLKSKILYSKDVNRTPYGINIQDLKKDFKIPIKSSCINISLLIINKLYEEFNIKGNIVLGKRGKIFHFFVLVKVGAKNIYIDEKKGNIYLYNDLPDDFNVLLKSIDYNGQNTLKELFIDSRIFQIGLYVKDKIFNILPRQWDLDLNSKKDQEKEKIYNYLLAKGKIIKKF